ncbi:hypothetical protein [Amycolatopsis sp. cg9]|uniref:hypothetical protein n=1 Tax=Amycolatopsis sp. cg9 TaxID=3238801 RepID=UPI003526B477
MTAAKNTRTRTPKDYGPIQTPTALGMPMWQFERAVKAGLIPSADPATGRWPAAVVHTALAEIEQIKAAVGSQPDVGASRAADVLAARFGIEVPADVLLELDRLGLIPEVGEYKDYPLYDGRALEHFDDRAALEKALVDGRLLQRTEVVEHLRVRASDVEHLIRANWLEPVTWVRSGRQRRRSIPAVPLFRAADLEVLLDHPAIDWDAVRATPAGRPSPLAKLSPRQPATASSAPA